MKITLRPPSDLPQLAAFARDIELAFGRVEEKIRLTYAVTLNFAAPGAVPGFTDQSVTIAGVEVGDTVKVGAPITPPAGFLPPVGFVSAANTVVVRWTQLSGAAADPDGAGGVYNVDVWRH